MVEITHQKVYFLGGPLTHEEFVIDKTTVTYEVYSTNQHNIVERHLSFYRGTYSQIGNYSSGENHLTPVFGFAGWEKYKHEEV